VCNIRELCVLCTGLDSKDRVCNIRELCVLCTGLDSKGRVCNIRELWVLCTGLDSKDRVCNIRELCVLFTGLDSKDQRWYLHTNIWRIPNPPLNTYSKPLYIYANSYFCYYTFHILLTRCEKLQIRTSFRKSLKNVEVFFFFSAAHNSKNVISKCEDIAKMNCFPQVFQKTLSVWSIETLNYYMYTLA
jgi:hypothetical protein